MRIIIAWQNIKNDGIEVLRSHEYNNAIIVNKDGFRNLGFLEEGKKPILITTNREVFELYEFVKGSDLFIVVDNKGVLVYINNINSLPPGNPLDKIYEEEPRSL